MPKLQRLNTMAAAHVWSLSANPEEEALNQILEYAKNNDLSGDLNRLFGRNIYPTDKPEPHRYEYYLTIKEAAGADAKPQQISGGLYAVTEVSNVCNLTEGWRDLFSWIKTSGYEPVGVAKGEHGWVNNAFEELVNWSENKSPVDWVFRLWVQLKE